MASSIWPALLVPSLAHTPPAAAPFCPRYHPIRDSGVYDPSGPLQDANGLWHTWEDEGAWSHWTSEDLIHWEGSFHTNTTNFGGDTGSVSPTTSGYYAFWPIMSGAGKGQIGSAKSNDPTSGLNSWNHRGPTISKPERINAGFRDPVRAFYWPESGKWYVGVGCGTKGDGPTDGAQFCLFEAEDDTLMNFTDKGSLYTTRTTFGRVDGNIVWQPQNASANMMECPDLFPLGDKWVLLGSLYKTNQWWVGTLAGNPPRFTPEQVGILDHGQGYAAKTGSTYKIPQSGTERRLVFGFTGWSEPTSVPGCGRSLIIPRELGVNNASQLTISPIPEAQALRVASSHKTGATLASGSQVEIRLTCPLAGKTGKIGVRTVASADGKQYLEVGYDLDKQAMYADHSKCCAAPNTIVQRAPLPLSDLAGALNLTLFVDGGLVAAFLNGLRVITPMFNPDPKAGAPEARKSVIVGTGCTAESWQLKYWQRDSVTV